GTLVAQLPTFQENIVAKLDSLQAGRSENGLIAQLARMASEISERISSATAGPGEAAPLQVELVQRQNPLAILMEVVAPLFTPVAMAGLVVVVVIFVLLERDDLRDRFIRLAGSNDIHKTTQ